jgi:hypothetical protein
MRSKPHETIRGAAALSEMLDYIGAIHAVQLSGDPIEDHAVAKILVDNEINLRALLEFAIDAIADEMG